MRGQMMLALNPSALYRRLYAMLDGGPLRAAAVRFALDRINASAKPVAALTNGAHGVFTAQLACRAMLQCTSRSSYSRRRVQVTIMRA